MEKEESDFATLILAAGSSSRLGRSKQLLQIQGNTLLENSIHAAMASASHITLVVLGSEYEEHYRQIRHLKIDITENKNWTQGIGSSIQIGMKKLISDHPKISGVVVMVCDQPFVTGKHISCLYEKHRETAMPIVASAYSGTLGVPAYFDRKYFQQLKDLSPSSGAKSLFKEYRFDVASVNFPAGETDVDTPADVEDLLKNLDSKKKSHPGS